VNGIKWLYKGFDSFSLLPFCLLLCEDSKLLHLEDATFKAPFWKQRQEVHQTLNLLVPLLWASQFPEL
jgi:hypothetical protein